MTTGWDDMLDQPMVTVRAQVVMQTHGFVIFAAGKRRCWALEREVRISRITPAGYADLTMTAVLARELGLATEKRRRANPEKIAAMAPESAQDGR